VFEIVGVPLVCSAAGGYTGLTVKARVYVTFKPSVLDPQGQTIRAALNGLGHRGIEDVRQGKYFEITMQPGEDLDAIARDVLSNPVIEDYRIEMLD
jgi:phosphoribosylformylglycinamidine synthase subunit PurS